MIFTQAADYLLQDRDISLVYDCNHRNSSADLIEFLVKQGNANYTKNALDVGCGEGRNSVTLNRFGYNVTAVDCIDFRVKSAKEYSDAVRPENKIKYYTSDILCFLNEHTDERYDLVVDCSVFHYLSKQKDEYIKAIFNSLNKGGKLFLQAFSQRDLKTREINGPEFFTPETLHSLFSPYFNINSIQNVKINYYEAGAYLSDFDFVRSSYLINLIGTKL